jgi:hypothetical protein
VKIPTIDKHGKKNVGENNPIPKPISNLSNQKFGDSVPTPESLLQVVLKMSRRIARRAAQVGTLATTTLVKNI